MKKILISSLLAASLATSISADTIGLETGASFWNAGASGDIQYKTGSKFDLADNLGLDDNVAANFLWVAIEHPIPLIPNIKIEKTSFSVDSKVTTVSGSGQFSGITATTNDKSELTLNQTDFKLYYELLDNWVNLDAGLNIKIIDGSFSIANEKQDISAPIPMLYAKAKIELPFSGFAFEADISYLGLGDSSFTDTKAGLLYETTYGLGATLGYKQQKLSLDDVSDYNAELTISGIYAGVFYHF